MDAPGRRIVPFIRTGFDAAAIRFDGRLVVATSLRGAARDNHSGLIIPPAKRVRLSREPDVEDPRSEPYRHEALADA